MSFVFPPGPATVTATSFPAERLSTLASVMISMPFFLKLLASSFEISASSTGRIAGFISIIVTFVPKAL
ncbi:hypothetical protein D3C83_275870 [compost metagenome]